MYEEIRRSQNAWIFATQKDSKFNVLFCMLKVVDFDLDMPRWMDPCIMSSSKQVSEHGTEMSSSTIQTQNSQKSLQYLEPCSQANK